MKRILTSAALCLTLALSLAAPATLASQNKNTGKKAAPKMASPHAEAVKKCNADYAAAVKKANDDASAAMKDAKGKKGKERADANKAASKAKADALAAVAGFGRRADLVGEPDWAQRGLAR